MHGIDLGLRVSGGGVHDMEEEVGEPDRIERGPKRLDKLMREVGHEPDRVGDQHDLTTGERQLSSSRVEGLKQAIGGRDIGLSELVEHGRLPGVRVTDQGYVTTPPTLALRSLGLSGLVDVPEISLQPMHAPHQPSSVDLELRLAGTSRPDPTRLLREPAAPASKSRQSIAQQREFHLCASFGRASVLGKDVEDHRRTIDGSPSKDLLQVPLLGRREPLIEHHGVDVMSEAQCVKLFRLPGAEEGGGIRRISTLDYPVHDIGPCRVHQGHELIERGVHCVRVAPRKDHADDDDPLTERPIDQRRWEVDGHSSLARVTVSSAIKVTSPDRIASSPSKDTPSEPPGLSTTTVAPVAPSARSDAAAATEPEPQANVGPTPRSKTLRARWSGPSTWTHSTLMPPVLNPCRAWPAAATSIASRSSTTITRCGLPTSATTRPASGSISLSVTTPIDADVIAEDP